MSDSVLNNSNNTSNKAPLPNQGYATKPFGPQQPPPQRSTPFGPTPQQNFYSQQKPAATQSQIYTGPRPTTRERDSERYRISASFCNKFM